MVANSPDVEFALISCGYDTAVANNEDPCVYWKRTFCEATAGTLTGLNRLIASVSSAGHSVSYFDGQPIDLAAGLRLLAKLVRVCPKCSSKLGPGPDPPTPEQVESYLNCLFARTRPVTDVHNSYRHLRDGCCC